MIPWLDTLCPICLAQPNTQCTTAAGVVLVYPHVERTRLADRLGVCRGCLSVEPLDRDGLVKLHKEMYGIARTDEDCEGSGQPAEVES